MYSLIWFGWDGGTEWIGRRDTLFNKLHSNPKAKFVTRAVQFGSEPLYDWAIEPSDLAREVTQARSRLADIGVSVTVSDMAYGYQEHDGAQEVLDAIDFASVHMLPFFATTASTGGRTQSGICSQELTDVALSGCSGQGVADCAE